MSDASSSSVRSLERGLHLLLAMNRSPQASVTQLCRDVGIPRPTAYRLLNTLAALGFVAFGSEGVRLTSEVRRLSSGFTDEAWIDVAWIEMVKLSRELIWPVSLFTHQAGTMVIRRTTHELSPMSIDYGMSGRQMPITETAAGLVYLAFCPDAEQRLILSMQPAYDEGSVSLERAIITDRLNAITAQGFDVRIGGVNPKTGSLAVPVLIEGRVLCCLSVVFIASAISAERAIAEFEQPMKQAAARITAAIEQQATPKAVK